MSIVPQTYNITTLITSPKIPTDFLWGLSAFFVGLAMVYFVSVFYFRNRITKEAQKIKEKKKELSPIVSEFLFYDENGDKIEKINYIGLKIEVRELIKSPFDRKVLTEILMDLRKDVSGTTRKELFHIYQDLGLHEDAFKKLKSWRWEVISKGIFELTQMHVEEAYKPITRFINDKRPTVRKQAEIAVVTLNREGIIYFLDHTTYRISEWQQLKLLDVVRNKEDYLAPPFRLWLTSKNNYVVLFALRLIKHYNQNDANISLITLIKHKSNQIKREAIHCIKEFYVTEALPVLKQTFGSNNTDIKMHILDAIAEIGSDKDIPFLQSISESNDTFMVKNKAVRAINTISPESILPTKDIEALSGVQDYVNLENGFVAKDVERNNQKELTHDHNAEELSSVEEEGSSKEDIEDGLVEANIPLAIPLETESVEYVKDLEIDEVEGIEEDSAVVLTETEIAFLPYVVDSEIEKLDDSRAVEKSLNEIIVDFEVVKAEKNAPLLDFSFLPLIIESQDERKKNVLELPVIYEEVMAIQKEASFNIEDLEVFFEEVIPVHSTYVNEDTTLDLLDFSEVNPSEAIGQRNTNLQKEEEEYYIPWPIDFEVQFSYDENHQEENFEEQLSYPDISSELIIPKPKFYEELDTMALLENIEELGDEREIPFLRSMMENETSPYVLEKTGKILDHFISRYSSNEEPKKMEPQKEHSVFEELIIKGDLESKLFLLNEIAELGDAKELYLLNLLVSDENRIISKTANQVLKVLKKRLEDDTELGGQNVDSAVSIEELIEKDFPDFFTLNFEPSGTIETLEQKEVSSHWNSREKGTLFDHLCNMSTKFYNKKNG